MLISFGNAPKVNLLLLLKPA